MKLSNFASLDPAITSTGRAGLKGAAAGDRKIWDEFHDDWEALAIESNLALAKLSPIAAADASLLDPETAEPETYFGETKWNLRDQARYVLSKGKYDEFHHR